jgi:hypothetical protein
MLLGLESVTSMSMLSCAPRYSSKLPPESCRRRGTLRPNLDPACDTPARLPIAVRMDGLTSLAALYVLDRDFFGVEDGVGGGASSVGCTGTGAQYVV